MSSDVKWIKIVTDIFDDEKMLLIESMPDHDAIIVCWFKLLCLAGKQNNHGVFLLNDKIAYTDEMLSTIFRRPLNTVRMALEVFKSFNMIEIIGGVITIPNWEKHQTLDSYEKKKERDRLYQASRRALQKQIAEKSSDGSADSSYEQSSYVAVSEEDIEEDIDNKEPTPYGVGKKDEAAAAAVPAPAKHAYGEYGWVKLTDKQYAKLLKEYGQTELDRCIRYVDESAQSNGNKNKWKDWNVVVQKCHREGWGLKRDRPATNNGAYDASKLGELPY